MKISVITVCYNAADTIEKTIESVKTQKDSEIEYIIIDGASEDGTAAIAGRLSEEPNTIVRSEPDNGIYDAMNKGLALATGDYVHFLNAGDTYCDSDVVHRATEAIVSSGADIVYGDIIYQYPDGKTEGRQYGESCAKMVYYLTGDCINHQAMFARKSLFDAGAFDLSYRICADREWMMRQSKRHATFYAMHFSVCVFSMDGASLIQKDLYRLEAKRCIRQHFLTGYPIFALFEFMRNNKLLAKLLHKVYQIFYITKR